jgi:hypothetical protein
MHYTMQFLYVDTGSGEENPAKMFKAEGKGSRLKLDTVIIVNVAGILSVKGKICFYLNYRSSQYKMRM